MQDKLELRIVTPERQVFSEHVDEVILPSTDGYMGVRPGHAPLLARLQVGEIAYRLAGKEHYLAVSGGFAEVLRTEVSVLAETAERDQEIDLERAEAARDRAQTRLGSGVSDINIPRAEVSLKKALNRISTHTHGRV